MEGIEGLLADFGLRPQGKAAPMAASRSRAAAGSAWPNSRSFPAPSAAPSYDGLFGGPPAAAASSTSSFDSLFGSSAARTNVAPAATVYDDDIFGAVPGRRPTSNSTSSSSARYDGDDMFGGGGAAAAAPAFDDVFSSNHSAPPPSYDDILGGFGVKPQAGERKRSVVVEDDDLLGGFGSKPHAEAEKKPVVVEEVNGGAGFHDLIPGFAGSSPPRSRKISGDNKNEPAVPTSKSTASIVDDPFVVLETNSASGSTYPSPGGFTDPLEHLDNSASSKGKNVDNTTDNDSLPDDSSAFDQVPKSDPLFTSEFNGDTKDTNPPSKAQDSNPLHSSMNGNPARRSSMEDLGDIMPKSPSARYSDIYVDGVSSDRHTTNGVEDQSPRSTESEDDIWLTVSEIPLFTQPTNAPPPSRSPPLLKQKPLQAKANGGDDEYMRRSNQNHNHYRDLPVQAEVSSQDEMEGFVKDKPQIPSYDNNFFGEAEQSERTSSDREEKERQARLEQEREMKLMEEKKREQRRLEKERELEQQKERERQAMERAMKEARERAAAEARAKAEREATQRAQRAAVQRAQKEVRERAAAEAKEKAARIAAEARERAASEAKERERAAAERAAAERVQQEARKRAERAAVERAAAEARERQAAAAAAAAREKQSSPDDLESFFGAGARANSAPKQRTPTVDSMFDSQPQGRGTANGSQKSASTSASMRKAPSATNIGDDLSDLFGAPTSSDVFQEVEGESEERRRARLERHQRTCERAAKALAEKNERDMQVQREQAERDRIADTLDFEIRRWAAGKEGNLRALLSTLQFILWPECGWQAVSLTDLITGAAVKKQYRKATLCIHPDKVQQKGATLQQKYTAEKVFDILKEAWNKFNSEELF
ncbi:hypothetical protein E2562_019699 [Oryza meyeriana var. granulata]|uniref:J domain-containing protein n=1 Tax=Oryza meyeriana var. granulata TaxID=110450 RepID=A0A6G1C7X1_9ORYZ|nr:hypothetical protein E2562_019699 [Oryza meyeriana var. granulata]